MTDIFNTGNEQPVLYTQEQVFELLQRLKLEEQTATQRAREERELPVDISSSLDNATKQQHFDNFKPYKREFSKYYNEEWTVGEEINKSFIPKLKNHTVDTTQVVNTHYKGSEISRIHGRAATEVYEQLTTIKSGQLSTEKAHQLLDETIESAKRLAIHAWVQARQFDEDAKSVAIKVLRLPSSIKHLEERESTSGKRNAFDDEFVETYQKATFQRDLLRQAANNNSSRGRGRGRGWNSNGREKNFQRG